MEIIPKKIQAVIFLKSYYFYGTEKLSQINNFKRKLADALQGNTQFSEPIVLPVLDEMPPDIPRFIMNSKSSDGYAVNGSANRVDLFSDYSGTMDDFNKFISSVKAVFNLLKDDPKCVRLALIFTYQNSNANSLSEITKYFASNNVPDEMSEYHTAYNERETFNNLKINKFVRIDCMDKDSQKIASLQLDINTFPDPSQEILDGVFDTFYNKAKETGDEFFKGLTDEQ